MNLKNLKYFFFVESLNLINIDKLKKFKNIYIIYSYTKNSDFNDVIKLDRLCKKNKIKLYISNYVKKFNNIKIDGIHIPSSNRSSILSKKKNVDIIGTAHNQKEYYIKKNQGCSKIFLSPLFFTKKYSNSKILNINKFNLISKNWKSRIMALGGIRESKLNQLNLLNIVGVGSIGLFK